MILRLYKGVSCHFGLPIPKHSKTLSKRLKITLDDFLKHKLTLNTNNI